MLAISGDDIITLLYLLSQCIFFASPPATGLAMTKSVLGEIKSAFASLLIEVRSALEKKRIKVKDVRQFFLGYFEGKCTTVLLLIKATLFNNSDSRRRA